MNDYFPSLLVPCDFMFPLVRRRAISALLAIFVESSALHPGVFKMPWWVCKQTSLLAQESRTSRQFRWFIRGSRSSVLLGTSTSNIRTKYCPLVLPRPASSLIVYLENFSPSNLATSSSTCMYLMPTTWPSWVWNFCMYLLGHRGLRRVIRDLNVSPKTWTPQNLLTFSSFSIRWGCWARLSLKVADLPTRVPWGTEKLLQYQRIQQ